MAPIKINTDGVKEANSGISANIMRVANIKTQVRMIRKRMDSEVLSRRRIRSRITKLEDALEHIESKLNQIYTTVGSAAALYISTEERLEKEAKDADSRNRRNFL